MSDKQMQHTAEVWSRVLANGRLTYPSEALVRFMASASKRLPPPGDAIDIGFGSGQHLKLFMDYGYTAHGTEIIQDGIESMRAAWAGHPLAGQLILGDLDHPDLRRNHFALAVAWGVVFLKPLADILWNLRGIYDLLKPGGECCLNFRTTDNWFFGLGNEISPGFYQLDERAGPYAQTEYCFVDEDIARGLCTDAGFEISNMERTEWWANNMTRRHAWFIFWLRKPE